MNNKEYLDTLILTGKLNIDIYNFDKIYRVITENKIYAKDILKNLIDRTSEIQGDILIICKNVLGSCKNKEKALKVFRIIDKIISNYNKYIIGTNELHWLLIEISIVLQTANLNKDDYIIKYIENIGKVIVPYNNRMELKINKEEKLITDDFEGIKVDNSNVCEALIVKNSSLTYIYDIDLLENIVADMNIIITSKRLQKVAIRQLSI